MSSFCEVLSIKEHRDLERNDRNYDILLRYKIVNVYRLVRYRLREEQVNEPTRLRPVMVDNKVLYHIIRSEGVLVRSKWY